MRLAHTDSTAVGIPASLGPGDVNSEVKQMSGFEHLVTKTQEAAAGHIGSLSTGEALAAALVLNRADWLKKMGYTIPEALDRIGPEWVSMLSRAAASIRKTQEAINEASRSSAEEAILDNLSPTSDEAVNVNGKLVTYGSAPGYRDTDFTLDLSRYGSTKSHRVEIRLEKDDSISLLEHMLDIHRVAWMDKGPLDAADGEKRPKWLA